MSASNPRLLYFGARLPARSETFVYREVFELRKRGWQVLVASVHTPERGLGSVKLDRLADEVICIYGSGWGRLFRDAATTCCASPRAALKVLRRAILDAVTGRSVPLFKRPKLIVHAIAALALEQRCRDQVIDHVHAHMAHVPTGIAMYWALFRGITFSFTGHAADLFRDQSLLPAKVRRAAFVACISHWHQRFYQRLTPDVDSARLPVVRCGVDVPPPRHQEIHDDGRPFRVLGVGRLVEKKGFEILVRALAALRDRQVPVVCRIIGDGPDFPVLNELARSLELGEVLQFLGARSNQEVKEEMQNCDLFVLPCRRAESGDRDGIPVVLMEAMAASVPVISGDIETIRELVQHDRTGWMVEPDNVQQLGAAIELLLGDNARRERLSKAGREFVQQEFSLPQNVSRLATAFRAGLAAHDTSRAPARSSEVKA